MRIGPHHLGSNLFLSPLAGYTNLPFRLVVRELGGVDWTTTDLVNARSLLEKNPRALQMIRTCPAEKLLAVQLFGAVPEEMRDAAAMVESPPSKVIVGNRGPTVISRRSSECVKIPLCATIPDVAVSWPLKMT